MCCLQSYQSKAVTKHDWKKDNPMFMNEMRFGKSVSAADMMATIARAKLTENENSTEIVGHVRRLTPLQLIQEYHRSVALLSQKQLLTSDEERALAEYADDFLHSPWASSEVLN